MFSNVELDKNHPFEPIAKNKRLGLFWFQMNNFPQ